VQLATVSSSPSSSGQGELLAERRLLADQVYDVLLTDIVRGVHPAGSRVQVDALASAMRVSRTPVREALTRLSWMRFVDVERNARTTVAEWGACEMRDRLRTAGRLGALVAADPSIDLTTIDPAPARTVDAVQGFLLLLDALVRRSANRVAADVVRDQLAPLVIFLRPDVLLHHGIDLAPTAARRDELMRELIAAAATGDRDGIVRLVGCFADTLASDLAPAVA
jgi:DNA-binding transcriptional regulator YhcF (GntR family)